MSSKTKASEIAKQREIYKRIRKQELSKKVQFFRKKGSKSKNKKTKYRAIIDPNTIRTSYEEIYESYCKLLGQFYHINTVWCFSCDNFYKFGSTTNMPKKCHVCGIDFYSPETKHKIGRGVYRLGYFSRPDFVIDHNSEEMRAQYHSDVINQRLDNIMKYHTKYIEKVGIVRIDGGVHRLFNQQKKDYKQYTSFKDSGIKVFIITNEDIDNLLEIGDNGKSMLAKCKFIGDCVLDNKLYNEVYCQDKDFRERIVCPV